MNTRAGERGAELLEAALVLSMLLTLLLGVFFLARAFNTYQTLTRAAQDAARGAALPSGIGSAFACPSSTTVQNSMTNALKASGIDPTKITNFSLNCDPTSQAGSSLNEPEVKLTFNYPFSIRLPLFTGSLTFQISARAKQED